MNQLNVAVLPMVGATDRQLRFDASIYPIGIVDGEGRTSRVDQISSMNEEIRPNPLLTLKTAS